VDAIGRQGLNELYSLHLQLQKTSSPEPFCQAITWFVLGGHECLWHLAAELAKEITVREEESSRQEESLKLPNGLL
jgi:hypothetical protein